MQPHEDIRHLQQNMMRGGEHAFKIVPLFLRNVIEEEQWKHCSDRHGNPFTSFEAFVTHQLWEGLESTIDDLKVFCRRNDEVRQLIDAAVGAMPMPGRPAANSKGSDATIIGDQTRGSTYQLKRLKRDRPDLAEKVVRGELSAHAAAIEAGFRKRLTPFETVLKLIPKLTDDERDHIRSMI
jgi:hypothetical protein